jgi:hypothetical protein
MILTGGIRSALYGPLQCRCGIVIPGLLPYRESYMDLRLYADQKLSLRMVRQLGEYP